MEAFGDSPVSEAIRAPAAGKLLLGVRCPDQDDQGQSLTIGVLSTALNCQQLLPVTATHPSWETEWTWLRKSKTGSPSGS